MIDFCKRNLRLFIYITLVLAFYITLISLYNKLCPWTGGAYLRKIADAMLFALPILFCKRKLVVSFYLLIASLYLLSIVWYFRTYSTIMPLSSYLMVENLNGLSSSIYNSMSYYDLLYIAPLLVFFLFYSWGHALIPKRQYAQKGWYIGISIFIIIVIVVAPYCPNKRPYYKQPFYLFKTEGPTALHRYGIIHFWIYQFASFSSVSDDDKQCAEQFVKRLSGASHFINDSSICIRKNLILILVESLQSWPIELSVGETKVMPNIDCLIRQDNVLYFPNVMSQVKDGRSSDAQLLINTGLLPLSTGAAASLCANNEFPSLAKALKTYGYNSVSFICDDKTFWNQGATTIAYGFDKLYDKMQGDNGRKEADEHLFETSLSVLKNMKQPFYAQLVTLSTHEPYVKPIIASSPLLHEVYKNNEVNNYLIALEYADKCIAEFIRGLKDRNLYDNSIIVITGDHEQMTFNKYEGREQLKAEDCFVPLIIINSSLSSKNTKKVIGQIDIYPSLLNLMGCYDYKWRGLGESVFGSTVSDYATFRTGLAAGGTNVSDSIKNYREECWKISDILLRMNYFK